MTILLVGLSVHDTIGAAFMLLDLETLIADFQEGEYQKSFQLWTIFYEKRC